MGTTTGTLADHNLATVEYRSIRVERRPCRDPDGEALGGLENAWIAIDNEAELNSYTTDALKELILALRAASNDRRVVAIVLTGTGTKAFSTGGNVREYATYYAGRPQEYRQYMRLFNDLITSILHSDKPVVNRVNGMRIAGGQEIGLACDLSIASDLARFGQAGPRHGSAPLGGSTDFLPLYLSLDQAMESATFCEHWSAHKAYRLGMLSRIVPALTEGGEWIPNPLVVTDRWLDPWGRIVLGEPKTGRELAEGKALLARGKVDLSLLDREVESVCARFAQTMPDCLTRTLESVRKHKLRHWDANAEESRAWLAVNMATEARAGFRAFHEGDRDRREVDFLRLRRAVADGRAWDDALLDELLENR